jgi:ubiquinone/menaquinone biosynthesis C-methylase UbiE
MTTARYDDVADFYEASFTDDPDPVMDALLDLLGSPADRSVLDVACGHGRVSRELARRGGTVTGVDLSRALLSKAEATEDTEPLGIRYVHADAATADWLGDERFDAVTCNFGLSDIDDLDGVLATVALATRPGGAFVLSVLHPCFPGWGPVSGAWPSEGRYYDEGRWTADGAASPLRRQVGANHRMLSTYVAALGRHGLRVEAMREPAPPAQWAAGERAGAARYPVYLVVRCRRD